MPLKELPYAEEMQDGRRKIPKSEHREIRRLYKSIRSTRKLAETYGVSRRTIVLILHPERLKKLQEEKKKKKSWIKYYDTDKQREYMRKYRAKKRKAGLIVSARKS